VKGVTGLRISVALCVAAAATGCKSEAERRADRLSDLREEAARGIAAAQRYCTERAHALARFHGGEAGWDRAIEEVLRAPNALDDFCEASSRPDEHTGEDAVSQPPANPGDTLTRRRSSSD
jgi:hypothetical protein